MRKLMMACATLSLSSCTHTPLAIDGYCVRYNKVVVEKGDGDIKAKPNVKKRILANELTYVAQCVPAK
jgi:hypothetical protein